MKYELPEELNSIVDQIVRATQPASIFIYGSRAREGDALEMSDYEIGILYERAKKASRRELAALHTAENINIYPFVLEDVMKGQIDTPFPPAFYLREIVLSGVPIYGEDSFSEIVAPPVTVVDCLETAIFEISYALGSLLSLRRKDLTTATIQFTKSVLFGARALLVLENKDFPLSYQEIGKQSAKLNIDEESKELVALAVEIRLGNKSLEIDSIFHAIKFLNQTVRMRIRDYLDKEGNVEILE